MSRLRLSITRRLFLSHFLAVVLVSGSIGTYFYLSAVESLIGNLQTRLENTARLAAATVNGSALDAVTGPQDVERPEYAATLALLRRLRATNQDIAYMYVMREPGRNVNGWPTFVVDTDPTEGQAMPGEPYSNAPDPLLAGFSGPSVDDRLYEDQWGVFMSGYSPIPGGERKLLLGLDMRDTEVGAKLRRIKISGLISLAFSIGLAALFSVALARRFNRPINLLIAKCEDVAEGRLDQPLDIRTGDELDKLTRAMNLMSARLARDKARREEAEAGLLRARDELEARVRDRTRELHELNERLLVEVEERRKAEAALRVAANTDALTGLPNRRSLEEHLGFFAARRARGGAPFAVLLADLDGFKAVNDTHGHEAGDKLLRVAADIFRANMRMGDMVGRWGGEEFLAILPDAGLDEGLAVAEKLRRAVAAACVEKTDPPVSCTVSLGVTACEPGQGVEGLLRLADEALYAAKSAGRDRVVARVTGASG